MAESSIEWTELTWNPTTGCDKLSAGCKFCYAEVMSRRLHAMGVEKYRNNFKITVHPDTLKDPFAWSGNRLVFVNSMSDLFHEAVPLTFIIMVFEVMNLTPQHTYQVLTKRADRLAEVAKYLDWTPNIWMGVSVEDKRVLHRIDGLRSTPAQVKFLSCEPLIGPLPGMDLRGIDWVIVGGESGRKPRPMHEAWVLDIKQQCEVFGADFFFKQWGGTNKKKAGRVLEGRTWDAMPVVA
ncbi:MAG: phage Gp37/Gp68 family protein [Flavobacteriales bacterium]|nr:phage Gp37/Gp68 family protein [Flavobacteriales bacterium]